MISLTPTVETEQQLTIPSLEGTEVVNVAFTAIETDGALSTQKVSATVDWNNGSQIEEFGPGSGTLSVDTSRALGVGKYLIIATVKNFRNPTPDVTHQYFDIQVIAPRSTIGRRDYLTGPILPKDSGSPNAVNWNFSSGSDVELLASSVKMLLITRRGERLMNPDYGTNINSIVFQQNSGAVATQVEEEIIRALTIYEPRVSLVNFEVERVGSTSIRLNVELASNLNSSTFELVVPFSQ